MLERNDFGIEIRNWVLCNLCYEPQLLENTCKEKAISTLQKQEHDMPKDEKKIHIQKPEALSQLHSLKIPETRLILILFGFISSFCCC
jgi:hypothetical protein